MTPHFLVVALGTLGDVLPFIGIGAELRRRGHEVTVLANPHFRDRVLAAELGFAALGTIDDYRQLVTDAALWDWKTFRERAFVHWQITVEPSFNAITELHRPGRTILVTSLNDGAHLAHERLAIPLAVVVHVPFFMPSRLDPPHPPRPLPRWARWFTRDGRRLGLLYRVRDHVRRLQAPIRGQRPGYTRFHEAVSTFRSRHGEPSTGSSDTAVAAPSLIIGTWPEWFAPPQPDWPARTTVTGFPFTPPLQAGLDGGRERGGEGGDPRPVVFTTGSTAVAQHEFFALAAETCRLLQRPGILVSRDATQVPKDLPPRVTHVEHAPFASLFPAAAAVVHHGGIGTTAYAFAAGIPQLIKPLVNDQYDTANRVERLGAGTMLDATHLRPSRLARVLDRTLNSPEIASRCRYWRSRVDPVAGIVRSADLIETLSGPET